MINKVTNSISIYNETETKPKKTTIIKNELSKIDKIKEKIKNGTYEINLLETTKKIVDELI